MNQGAQPPPGKSESKLGESESGSWREKGESEWKKGEGEREKVKLPPLSYVNFKSSHFMGLPSSSFGESLDPSPEIMTLTFHPDEVVFVVNESREGGRKWERWRGWMRIISWRKNLIQDDATHKIEVKGFRPLLLFLSSLSLSLSSNIRQLFSAHLFQTTFVSLLLAP